VTRTNLRRLAAPGAFALTAVLALSACSAANDDPADSDASDAGGSGGESLSGRVAGGGASSQEAAQAAWSAGFQTANPDATINYDPVGSGGGREGFINGSFKFAGSDAYLEDKELTDAKENCGGSVIEVPAYVSPIAVVYNLPEVDSLNLSADNIAGIFAGEITTWNDPAIAEDNPDVELPDTAVNPVHRSDESGTTENFTSYLTAAAPDVWTAGEVETWPTDLGGEAGNGTSGVVSAVNQGEGSIGYADASQAGELGTAAVGVGEEFVEYSPEAAAAVIDASEPVSGRDETDLAIDVARDTTESGVYPIVLVSYLLACPSYDNPEEAALVKGYLEYIVSEEGQQAAAKTAGSAPISDNLREQAQTALETIETS
jgi:phosphate transport system substrate-binding protein